MLEKKIRTFGIFLFKYSFMDMVIQLKDLSSSEKRLQNGKSTKNEISKLGEACGLDNLASIQPTSSQGVYRVIHSPKIFFKLIPTQITIGEIEISLSKETRYGYNRNLEFCMEEDIRFEQELNIYICKDISMNEPVCNFATLSDNRDSCGFDVRETRGEKGRKMDIFGFEKDGRYYLVKTKKRMDIKGVNRTVISKIYKYFLSVPTLKHELQAVTIEQYLTIESLQEEIFRSKEILFGLLIAVATNLVFILSMVIRKCLKGLRRCVNFILSRTANREDVEFQGEEIENNDIPLRVRRAHGNRSGYPSVRFEEIGTSD